MKRRDFTKTMIALGLVPVLPKIPKESWQDKLSGLIAQEPRTYYIFEQNNSFGFFEGPLTLAVVAKSADQANELAEASGLVYFDGTSKPRPRHAKRYKDSQKGRDCACCGDRWQRVTEYQYTVTPNIEKDLRDHMAHCGFDYTCVIDGKKQIDIHMNHEEDLNYPTPAPIVYANAEPQTGFRWGQT